MVQLMTLLITVLLTFASIDAVPVTKIPQNETSTNGWSSEVADRPTAVSYESGNFSEVNSELQPKSYPTVVATKLASTQYEGFSDSSYTSSPATALPTGGSNTTSALDISTAMTTTDDPYSSHTQQTTETSPKFESVTGNTEALWTTGYTSTVPTDATSIQYTGYPDSSHTSSQSTAVPTRGPYTTSALDISTSMHPETTTYHPSSGSTQQITETSPAFASVTGNTDALWTTGHASIAPTDETSMQFTAHSLISHSSEFITDSLSLSSSLAARESSTVQPVVISTLPPDDDDDDDDDFDEDKDKDDAVDKEDIDFDDKGNDADNVDEAASDNLQAEDDDYDDEDDKVGDEHAENKEKHDRNGDGDDDNHDDVKDGDEDDDDNDGKRHRLHFKMKKIKSVLDYHREDE